MHQTDHLWMLTSGQLERNNFVNTEAKYCKFAYSTRYGFTIERGRYGLSHAAPDSMLLLCGKMITGAGGATDAVTTADGMIYSRWRRGAMWRLRLAYRDGRLAAARTSYPHDPRA